MGTCLAVTKIIGSTSLGIFAGYSLASISQYDVLVQVLNQSNAIDFKLWNGKVSEVLTKNSIVLTTLGGISSTLFLLSYNSSPLNLKHPYLIYSSLVLPISALILGALSKDELLNYFQIGDLIECVKTKKITKQAVTSELDNSIYKDLGEDSDDITTPEGQEDDEITQEVEFHLNKTSVVKLLKKIGVVNKVVAGVSFLGFVISSIGIYGDY